MPERGWASECWASDEWFQELNRDQRYLFIYLSLNEHVLQSGLYHITLTTLANETKFSKDELREIIPTLVEKVKWWPEANLIWVKNFLKRQMKSSKFVQAAAKSLIQVNHNGAVKEVIDYYQARYSISIPYQYYMDKVSIPSDLFWSVSGLYKGGVGDRESEGKGTGEIDLAAVPIADREEAESLWSSVQKALVTQVSKSNYRTWITNTIGVKMEEGQLLVGVANTFVAEYLEKNQRSLILKELASIMQADIGVRFVCLKEAKGTV